MKNQIENVMIAMICEIAEGKSNVDNNIKPDFVKQNYVDKMLDQSYYENQMDGQKV